MKVIPSKLKGALIIVPQVFGDGRGYFYETFQKKRYIEAGVNVEFVQDNRSKSAKGVLRGLHFQKYNPQGKLVTVTQGEVFDVAVDLRIGSATFGEYEAVILSGENKKQFYIPEGFAHGFYVLSDTAEFQYKCSDYYNPEDEGGLIWNDPDIKIPWPLVDEPLLSDKDASLPRLHAIKKQIFDGWK
jgi:dTDP-4-dehydrorhamnose 3,5-epimerase